MKRHLLAELTSIAFIILFIYAAASKLIEYQQFRIQLGQSPLLTTFAGFVAWSIPLGEIIIAVALTIPKYRMIGLYGSFGLMSIFTVYIFFILNYSDYVPCSCGGVLSKLDWNAHLFFNLTFVALATISILASPFAAGRKIV